MANFLISNKDSEGRVATGPKPSCCWSKEQYRKQVERIKILTAHYRPENENGPLDFKITSLCLQEGCRGRANSEVSLEQFSLGNEGHGLSQRHVHGAGNHSNGEEIERNLKYAKKDYHCDAVNCNPGKMSQKFTPANYHGTSGQLLISDNEGANGSPDSLWASLQPMKLSTETGASIINMPSPMQGQAFSNISSPLPDSGHSFKLHHRNTAQPVVQGISLAPSCYDSSQRHSGTGGRRGWRRNAHSATMYTRYKCPEFALMYSDLEASTASTLCLGASDSFDHKGIKKFR